MPVEGSEQELSDLFGDVLRSASGVKVESEDSVAAPADGYLSERGEQSSEIQTYSSSTPQASSERSGNAMHWTVGPGDARQYKEYFAAFRGANITRLSITDPYCMTQNNRPRLAIFVAELCKAASRLDELHVTAWSPTSRALRDSSTESPGKARTALEGEIKAAIKPSPRVNVRFVEDRRTYRGDFHDRDIYFDAEIGGRKSSWYMNLSGGIERLVELDRKCDILLRPLDQSAPS
jgi:hypothetical protein